MTILPHKRTKSTHLDGILVLGVRQQLLAPPRDEGGEHGGNEAGGDEVEEGRLGVLVCVHDVQGAVEPQAVEEHVHVEVGLGEVCDACRLVGCKRGGEQRKWDSTRASPRRTEG